MQYGILSEAGKTNNAIYRYLEFLDKDDQVKFVRKFKEQPHDESQVTHTFRELQLGAFLRSNRLDAKHERLIFGKKPDWCILNAKCEPICIVECVYHHSDNATEEYLKSQRSIGRIAIGYFPHANDPTNKRLYSKLQDKATSYQPLVTHLGVQYVIAVYCDFLACIDLDEMYECLLEHTNGIFALYAHLSGVIHVDVNTFTYIKNPWASNEINLPSGTFD